MYLDILAKIAQALLNPITNIFSIYVTDKNNSYKQHLDLYDRGFPIYQSVLKFINKIITDIDKEDSHKLINEALIQLHRDTEQAQWLFGQDIIDYIEELKNRAKTLKVNFNHKNNHYKYNISQRDTFSSKYDAELDWFCDQYPLVEKKFQPYLKLN